MALGEALHGDGAPGRGDGSREQPMELDGGDDGPASSAHDPRVAAVQTSCLIPFLITELGRGSFTDMCSRYAIFVG